MECVFEIVRIKRVQFLGDGVDVNSDLKDGVLESTNSARVQSLCSLHLDIRKTFNFA